MKQTLFCLIFSIILLHPDHTFGKAMIMSNGVSVPGDFPLVNIFINDQPCEDHIFIDNRGGRGTPYNIIFDNSGNPVWYTRTESNDERRDFKKQPNGWITMMVRRGYGADTPGFAAFDENFNYVKSFRAANGCETDEHELLVRGDGSYFLIGLRDTTVDMSQYITGGNKRAVIKETSLQAFSADDRLLWEWPALKHFNILDATIDKEELRNAQFRFPHMNSIDIDTDGHVVLSSRVISEVTKINMETREIIWRLGGENNQFIFVNDPMNGFQGQHSVRVTGENRYLLFDNGYQRSPNVSRAVEYELDTEAMTATLIWAYQDGIYAYYMGNVQRLPNGNTLINWAIGSQPKLTEVRPDGNVAFEMNFKNNYECYRVHRCPWQGVVDAPYLIGESNTEATTLVFNKFGDADVAWYNIYADQTSGPTTLIDTSQTSMKSVQNLNQGYYYFRVTAVNSSGGESAFSNEVGIMVQSFPAGANMVANGDFSANTDSWSLGVDVSANAVTQISGDGELHFQIAGGGSEYWHIQFQQGNFPLIEGETYTFEFDARADAPRLADIKIEEADDPWTNYGRINLSYLTPVMQHFSCTFTMQDPTDDQARIVFNIGNDDADVFIDNVSLIRAPATHVDKIACPSDFKLQQNYPNPFNPSTTIRYSIPASGRVSIAVYNVIGQRVKQLVDMDQSAGEQSINLDGSDLNSGIYFFRMEFRSTTTREAICEVRKLMLIK